MLHKQTQQEVGDDLGVLRSKPINCIRENKIHTATWLKSHDFKGGTLTP